MHRANVEESKSATGGPANGGSRKVETLRWSAVIAILAATVLHAGCQEFVHMGQISDREGAFAVNDVKIEQAQKDGSWKYLGNTDGNGRWWIIKEMIKGGGNVRMSKPGYHTVIMSESEFFQQVNILMAPADTRGGSFGEGAHSLAPAEDRPHR